MTEKRFSYNPFTKHFLECSQSHSISLYNIGKQKQADEYIRVILIDNTLYIRTYYPFDDIDSLSLVELNQKSYDLITQYQDKLVEKLKKYNIIPSTIIYNVDNDLLRGINLANI